MKVPLTLACGLYDRTLPLADGSVTVEGADMNVVLLEPGEMFQRQARHAEFDVAEFSVATYTILHTQGDRRTIALPIFPSRRFRHGHIFVSTRAGIRAPGDLAGKRMGAGEFQQTAAVWMRGLLHHEYGVRTEQIEWYFGGYAHPEAFVDRIPVELPPAIRTHTIPADQSLDQLLDAGEIQGLIGTSVPPSLQRGSPHVARLFPNYVEAEREYYQRTGILPIMHLVVLRRSLYEQHPWLAASLLKAFHQAKELSYRRLARHGTLFCGLPWLHTYLEETRELMGRDPWPYGLAPNRAQLEVFYQYMLEQGLIPRPVTIEELYAPETHDVEL
jgi:4,5-dihydroxyphthalate decarboxylase